MAIGWADGRAVSRGGVVALGCTVVALLLTLFGLAWDVSWHRTIGRDTFFSPPHLFLYAGVALQAGAALAATLASTLGAPLLPGRQVRLGALRTPLGFALGGLGAALVIGSAPFDELWHRAFGRDVDIWSPPHLLAIGGHAVVVAGLLLNALALRVFAASGAGRRLGQWLTVCLFAVLALHALVASNWYWMESAARDPWRYPAWLAAFLPAILVVAHRTLDWRWGACAVAIVFAAINLIELAWERQTGWRSVALAPLILPAAALVDTALWRGERRVTRAWQMALAVGLLWTLGFYAAEWLRLTLLPPPSLRLWSVDPILRPYLIAVRDLPWQPLNVALALPAVSLIAAASALAGLGLARLLAAVRRPPPPARTRTLEPAPAPLPAGD